MKLYQYKIKREYVRDIDTTPVCNPKAAAEAIRATIDFDREQEQLVVLFLDGRNQIKGTHLSTIGTLDASLAHPREIYRAAILANSAAVIIGHNLCGATHKLCNVKSRVMCSKGFGKRSVARRAEEPTGVLAPPHFT